jgi:transcriptional regulator GlxA family with amidase domain
VTLIPRPSRSPASSARYASTFASRCRLVSICTGAFALAATGRLDGRRATTHWAAAGELARRHPTVTVDPDVLFVDDGQVLTSAGAAAGLDLCLHIVRRDDGAAVAAQTARACVMRLERAGGQAQFITTSHPLHREAPCNRCSPGWPTTSIPTSRSPTSRSVRR